MQKTKVQKRKCGDLRANSSSKIWTPIHYRKYSRVYLRTDLQVQLLAKKTPTAGGWIFRIQTPPGGASKYPQSCKRQGACANKELDFIIKIIF